MMECEICGKLIGNQFNFRRHIKQIHENKEEWKCCMKCNKLLKTEANFYKNEYGGYKKTCKICCIKAVDNTSIYCPKCGIKTSKRNLKRHYTSLKCQVINPLVSEKEEEGEY